MKGVKRTTLALNKLVKLYEKKKITRKEIAKQLAISDVGVINAIRRRGIDIWDHRKRDLSPLKEIYRNQEMTRREICEKYGLKFRQFTNLVYKAGIELWDIEEEYIPNNYYPYKFYHPKLDKSNYARLFYDYNS